MRRDHIHFKAIPFPEMTHALLAGTLQRIANLMQTFGMLGHLYNTSQMLR